MPRSRRRTHQRLQSGLPRLSEHSEGDSSDGDALSDGGAREEGTPGEGGRWLAPGGETALAVGASGGDPCLLAGQGEVDGDAVRRKIDKRVLPIFFSVAMLCYLDRSNLNYASIPLSKQLGFSDLVYGFGAGIFAVGYALFQVPSNLLLAQVGARRWLAVLMTVWGVVACCMAGINNATSFHVLRFLLGIAECGTFPGMWYHLSLFYSAGELGPAYAVVTSATALASVLGGFLAAGLLCMDGVAGLHGWQWLFLAEGLPTIALAIYLGLTLPDSPATASFLTPVERQWLQAKLAQQAARAPGAPGKAFARPGLGRIRRGCTGMCGWRVWYIGAVWLLVECSLYGILFWSNKLIQSFVRLGGSGGRQAASTCLSGTTVKVSLLSVIPFGAAAATMLWVAARSKARNERRFHTAVPVFVAAMAMLMMPALEMIVRGYLSFVAMTAAASGIWAVHGPLLSWPATFLVGSDAAGGYALINSLGSLGGFVGPVLIGAMSQMNGGSYDEAMYLLSGGLLLAALLVTVFPAPRPMRDSDAPDDTEENEIIRSAELVSFLQP
eukprot:jgi/Tetstr1/447816/TSEL_035146.t1